MKRRTHRKGTRRNRTIRGGYVAIGSNVGDSSMNSSSKLNALQGQEYAKLHANQHGGMAPVGDTGVMDVGRVEARLGPLDASFQEIAGMKVLAGGRRRRASRKGRNGSRKTGRKSRRCMTRRNNMRRMRGGKRSTMRGGVASVSDSTTLLPVGMEKEAVMGMNPEWKLAEDPAAFNPKH